MKEFIKILELWRSSLKEVEGKFTILHVTSFFTCASVDLSSSLLFMTNNSFSNQKINEELNFHSIRCFDDSFERLF